LREISALGIKRGGAIAGFVSTAVGLGVYLVSHSLPWALAATFLLLFLSVLGAAHELWQQRNAAIEARMAIEQRPEARIDAALTEAIELREELTYKASLLTEKEQRVKTMALIVGSRMVVAECAPAFFDDLETEEVDGAGTQRLIGVVNEYYRVLAAVRKQLTG
jgi:hypothetical protein